MYSEVQADIFISLRQDNIVSATEFDFDVYHKWNPSPAEAEGENQTAIPARKTRPVSRKAKPTDAAA